jgi:predicted esterase
VPIFLYHGEDDELVPVGLSATAAQKYCRLGVPVSRKTYPGADHTSVVPQALLDISTYLQARLSGQAAPSTC